MKRLENRSIEKDNSRVNYRYVDYLFDLLKRTSNLNIQFARFFLRKKGISWKDDESYFNCLSKKGAVRVEDGYFYLK